MLSVKMRGIVLVIALLLASITLGITRCSINQSIMKYNSLAQQHHPHPGNDVAALIDFLNSTEHSLLERNHAIWTLGRHKDKSALPVLESYYTGAKCDHDSSLCQHELAKTIVLCGGVILEQVPITH